MIDPLAQAVPPDISGPTPPPDGWPGPVASGADGVLLSPRQLWRLYRVGAPAEGSIPGVFFGQHVETQQPVLLCARVLTTASEWHRQAWDRLQQLGSDRLIPCLEAGEEAGHRIEVCAVPDSPTLHTWMEERKVAEDTLVNIVRQLTAILQSLHTEGVVHLNLRTDTVYLEDRAGELVVVVGGLHAVTLYEQPNLVPVEVNPFFAPPEAAGLCQLKPGRNLCTWDWWSLGRLVQECLLGRPSYALRLDCDARRPEPDQLARAETLLLERDAEGYRAGAVELMPAGLSPRMRALLRGLLASSPDGRWQSPEVERCLLGETVGDHYDLPRDTRLFLWRDRAYTLPEAAEFFCDPARWTEGEAILFAPAEDPAGLRYFLAQTPALHALRDRVQELLGMTEIPDWEGIPDEARRTAVATLLWLALGAATGKEATAFVRGRRIDAAGLHALLEEEIPGDAVALLQAMTVEQYLRRVESLGAGSAARLLGELAATAGKAIRLALEEKWAEPADHGMKARLYALALEADAQLAERLSRLQARYAANRNPTLTTLLNTPRPERWAQALLGFMGAFAADYGFVTHEEWNHLRYLQLRQRAELISRALFWHRLRRVLLAGPAAFGTWPMHVLFWGVPLVLAGAAQAWLAAGIILTAAVAVRLMAHRLLNAAVRREAPSAAAWSHLDRPQRCLAEAAGCVPATAAVDSAAVLREFRGLAAEAATLPLPVRPKGWPRPPNLGRLWLISGLTGLAVLVLTFWQIRPLVWPPALPPEPVPPPEAAAPVGSPTMPAAPAPAEPIYEEVNDGFGPRKRGPRRAWDIPAPDIAPPLIVQRVEEANPEQAAYALVSGELLLEPYPRKGLNVLLAIRVPVHRSVGLVLLDTRLRRLVDTRLFVLAEAPAPQTWYQLGERRIVYLGEPPGLSLQNSLALH